MAKMTVRRIWPTLAAGLPVHHITLDYEHREAAGSMIQDPTIYKVKWTTVNFF